MPTIHREAGYAFRFRSGDRREPPHIHVEGNGGSAKFWLDGGPRFENAIGYNRRQLTQIGKIVETHAGRFASMWHEYFD